MINNRPEMKGGEIMILKEREVLIRPIIKENFMAENVKEIVIFFRI